VHIRITPALQPATWGLNMQFNLTAYLNHTLDHMLAELHAIIDHQPYSSLTWDPITIRQEAIRAMGITILNRELELS